jgi:hypothetical protein
MNAEHAPHRAAEQERPASVLIRLPAILRRFVTPEAVYGLVLYAAIVAAASDETDPGDATDPTLVWNESTITISDSVGVLIWVALSIIVFWAAHVFAHAVADHGVRNGRPVTVAKATRDAFHHSSGMLYAPIVPTIALIMGALGIIPDPAAIEASLWISVAVLGVLGYLAFVAKRAPWFVSVLGGLATAVLGLLIILLNAVMH